MSATPIDNPGKYDAEATAARYVTEAQCVLLIVLGGYRGSGFSVQSEQPDIIEKLPELLRTVAANIEQELAAGNVTMEEEVVEG
jgi:hypothetical protein